MKTPTSQRRTYRDIIGEALAMKQAANKDLRSAFAMLPAAGAPNDDGGDGDEDDSDDDEDDDDADDDKSGSGGDGGSDDEQDDDDASGEDEVQNKRIKELSDENAKWRRRVRRLERELKATGKAKKDEDSGPDPEVITLKAENAFLRSASNLGITTAKGQKAALKFLQDYQDDYIVDGTVDADEMKAALEEIVEEYPWIKDEAEKPKSKGDGDNDDDDEGGTRKQASGRQTNGKKKSGQENLNKEALAKKFPALRR